MLWLEGQTGCYGSKGNYWIGQVHRVLTEEIQKNELLTYIGCSFANIFDFVQNGVLLEYPTTTDFQWGLLKNGPYTYTVSG